MDAGAVSRRGPGEPETILVADLHGRVALSSDLRALLNELAESAIGEPDCLGFRVLAGEEPGEFLLLATWASEDALRAHYQTSHYRHYRAQVGALLARPSDVVVYRLSATIHALDPNPPEPGQFG